MGSVLSIDYGLKRIGLAFSDPNRVFSFAYGTISNEGKDFVINELRKIIQEKDIDLIIVGMPLNMDGTKGEIAIKVEKFIELIEKTLSIRVEKVDERLSSFIAEENLKGANLSSKKVKKYVDVEAARLMLEEYINSYKFH